MWIIKPISVLVAGYPETFRISLFFRFKRLKEKSEHRTDYVVTQMF
jgi:5,10-methylenetetrahydrofolate reductase